MMKRVCALAAIISICIVLTLSTSGKIDSSDKKTTGSVEYNAIGVNTNIARATTTVFSETFEGAWPGSWTVGDSDTGSGTDYWGDNTYRYYAGSWSGYCSDEGDTGVNHLYDNDMYAYMYRSVSLSGYSSATLTFYLWLNSEASYDYFKVIYYTTSWIDLYSKDGNTGGWIYVSVSVPTTATSVGFLFDSDVSYTYEGAYIDNVVLTGTTNSPPNTPSTPSGPTSGTTGTSYTYSTSATDPDGDNVKYTFDWGDATQTTTAFVASGTSASASHSWSSAGTYSVKAYATDSNGATSGWSGSLTVTITATVSLGEAVDNTALTWTTGGNANWFGQTTTYYYGSDAAQSGVISDSQSTYIQTTVIGSGTLKFYWKVSSEASYDLLRFYIDGTEQSGSISGSVDWQQKSFSITSGSHTLKWAYTKDVNTASGSDCGWLDKVEFAANSPPPVPTLSSPSDGATGISTTPTLVCNSVTDPNSDSVWYYFEVDDNADWSSPATQGYAGGASDTNYVVGTDGDAKTLLAGTKYYWCVDAYDGTDFSGWSSVWSFTTATPNSPPNAPSTPSGPTSGSTGTSYTYSTSATDPDGNNVKYTFDWYDGTTTTTAFVTSGTSASASHSWSGAGTYYVKAKAIDSNNAESGWSSSLTVTITGPNSPPNTPATPSGPTSGITGTSYTYSTSATDPNGDNVKYTFDWGDGTITTTAFVASGTSASASHSWSSAGTYYVKAYATDINGATSGWSSSLTVTISWGSVGPSGLVYVLVSNSVYTSLQTNLTTYKSDLESEGYSVGIYNGSWTTIGEVRTLLQNGLSSGLVGAVLVGNIPIAWYRLKNPDSWGANFYETFPIELYYMDLNGTWTGTGIQTAPFTDHTGNVAPEIWVGRLYASTAGVGAEGTVLNNYLNKIHNYRLGNLKLPQRALVYVDDDWYSYADQWDSDVGLLYTNRTLVKDQETTTDTDYKNRLTLQYEWISLFSHSDSWYHAMKYNNGASWSYVYNTDITTIDPRASFYNLYCCYAANYSDGADNGYLGGRYIFQNTYGLAAVGSTKTGSMLNFDDFYSPLKQNKSMGEAFKAWYSQNGETGVTDSRAWFYGMTVLGDPTLKPNTTTTDTTPPTGSISINSGDTYTTTTSITLTLSANDAETGVLQMCFSNDGTTYTAWETYATSKAWTLTSSDGTKTVYVKYKNGAGLVSSAYFDTITLDTTAPTGSIIINSGDAYATSTSVTLTLSASDTTSGVSQTCFSNDGTTYTAWEAYTSSKSWSLTTGDGTKTVYVKYKDNAGLVSSAYLDTIILDTTAPTGSVVINAGDAYTTSTSVTLTLSASDATSGVSQMCFSNDGTTYTVWETYATSKAWTLTTGDGTKTVYVKYKNGAGLISSAYSDSIILDTTAPTGSITINSGATYTMSTSVTLSLTYSDATSSVSQVRYSNDGTWDTESWESPSGTKSWTLPTGDGTKTVYYQIKDNAGWESITYSDTTTLDTTTPTITSTTPSNNAVNVSLTQNIIIQFTEEMNTSSVLYTCFPNPSGWVSSWNAAKNTLTLAHNEFGPGVTYTFNITVAKDPAGNGLASGPVSNPWTFTTEKVVEFDFQQGSNSFTLPFVSSTIKDAESLANAIGKNCTGIAYWDNTLGRFITHPAGTDISNFNIELGVGYMVFVSGKTVFTFTGESKINSVTMSLGAGWNSIGRFNETTTTAEIIGSTISNCTHIAKWNATSQSFDVYVVGSGINNFNIEQGDMCLVYVTKGSQWVNQ